MKLFWGLGNSTRKKRYLGRIYMRDGNEANDKCEDWKEEGWVICGSAGTDLRVITDSDSAHSSISLDLRSVPD